MSSIQPGTVSRDLLDPTGASAEGDTGIFNLNGYHDVSGAVLDDRRRRIIVVSG
ncbi:hypothetical protein GU243_10955 [Pseudarthrobacter psychrotolerans]|uniref:Uncharacterized protein n=1 Tax=Pseudarthrobacter psychrotolerans TaxID=2697569 RepID=A0A6P1NHS5_9MICC|nr:hypothetical protein [Pseudarthrobacter psychrotolerans]QHK20165.1 hypothetical protein GU243_10955 [Pseudarthrobacter psychrotolerans]